MNAINTTTALASGTVEAPKPKTVIDDMDSRRLFDTAEDASAYLTLCQTDFTDFESYPIAPVGVSANEETGVIEFDPEIYTEQMQIAIAVLTQRGEGPNSSTVKCIVIYPSPKPEALFESGEGQAWIAALVAKEANHVAVRQLRKADDAQAIADAIGTMPTTLADYTTSGRESTGGILETFNDLWQVIKKAIGERSKAFALANLSKKELRKAMESASYAAAVYPTLETRKNKKGEPESFFNIAALFGQTLAKQGGKDATIFDRMLSTRNEKKIDLATDDDEQDFDIEAMAVKVAAKAAETPAAEAPATEGEATGEQAPADSTEAPTPDTDGSAT